MYKRRPQTPPVYQSGSEKVQLSHHRLFTEVTVDTSHLVLVHLVQLGMNLQTQRNYIYGKTVVKLSFNIRFIDSVEAKTYKIYILST